LVTDDSSTREIESAQGRDSRSETARRHPGEDPLTRIPFNKPACLGREMEYIREAIAGAHISGDGAFNQEGACASGRGALRPQGPAHDFMHPRSGNAALLLDVKPAMSSSSLPSPLSRPQMRCSAGRAAGLRGHPAGHAEPGRIPAGRPHHAPHTAIVVVHYAGVGCSMDAILNIAGRYGIPVVEDNAHGLMGRYREKLLGTFGCLAALSFHETKNFTCGEGGALLINDPTYIERAEILREKGTNRSRFFRGEIDRYSWVDLGSSYLPSDMLAAFLYAQMEAREQIQARRKNVWNFYFDSLQEWATAHSVRLPVVPGDCQQAFHMFYCSCPAWQSGRC